VALASALVVVACGGEAPEPDDAAEPAVLDSGVDAPAPLPAGPPKRLFAKRFVVKVHARPVREAERLGYLRAGSTHMATTHDPVGTDGCREGWYELTTGGFVCNGRDVIAFEGRRLPARPPVQPDFEAPLPYRYARSRRDNLAVYRRLPTDDEAAQYEGYRIPGREPPPEEAGSDGATADPVQPASGPAATAAAEVAVEEPAEVVVPTLASLEGERGGVLLRRALRGFIVSVDRDVRIGPRRYWRTLANEFVPYNAFGFVNGSSFQGVHLAPPDQEGAHLPVGFVMSSKVSQFTRGRDGRPRRGRAPGYHHSFPITGEETHRDTVYVVTPDDRLFRADEVRIVRAATELPTGVGESDKWIDVDLGAQTLVAYEGLVPVFATLVSTGRVRDPDDPLRDMRTPTGLFRITSKHVTHTMDGDHAADGPYSIQDVPYVMYFQLAYALHSAFWHDGFGRPRSHGCVNLSPLDARWLFQWAGPTLPEGWHAVFPRPENPATWVHVHGETPEG
jgi:lipoprotein-anchoring transpeptidase ErfK/SrfK